MSHSLYLHIPFCKHRCAYCDFNTYAGQEDLIPAYVDALEREIEMVGASAPERIDLHTIFFGGGTPSLLSPEQFKTILGAIRRNFDLRENAEITMEANPGTITTLQLRELRSIGINRVSFGAQSANGEELRMLERAHSFLDVIQAVASARAAGIDNLNLDVIYGLPEQTLETLKTTVGRVIELRPEHISAYALTLEHGTPFGNWAARGLLPIPDPDAAAEMYEWASDALETAGYLQYEISNWGQPIDSSSAVNLHLAGDREPPHYACQHNLQYWRCLPYLGLGAGAHGYANGVRYSNVLRIKTYIERMQASGKQGAGEAHQALGSQLELGGSGSGERAAVQFPLTPAAVNQHRQTREDDVSEYMIMGLRLTGEGILAGNFRHRFGRELTDVYGAEISDLIRLGLLTWAESRTSELGKSSEVLKLTVRGRLLGNQVFMRFV
jgi:putative oxygen-independent coproporphyrinogen III oxidase